MNAEEILIHCADVMKERGKGYDKNRERAMGKIVSIFNILTNRDLSIKDGYQFMIALKLVRGAGRDDIDDPVDLINYTALMGELLDKGKLTPLTDIGNFDIDEEAEDRMRQIMQNGNDGAIYHPGWVHEALSRFSIRDIDNYLVLRKGGQVFSCVFASDNVPSEPNYLGTIDILDWDSEEDIVIYELP